MAETDRERKERERQEDLARLRGLRPIDDDFMRCIFRDNKPLAQLVLRIVTGKNDLTVVDIATQKDLKRLVGARSICLDADVTDSNGKKYDMEIQRADHGAGKHRARYHSSCMDVENLDAGQKFDELPDTYTIFITEHDVFKKGKALYPIERINLGTQEMFDDGEHILYVYGQYRDDSEIGKLMHDFREQDPDKMYFPELRDGVSHFKKAEKGRDRMGGEVEEYAEEYSKKRSENAAINSAIKTCRDLNPEMTDSQIKEYIMRSFGLSEETAGKYFTPQPA